MIMDCIVRPFRDVLLRVLKVQILKFHDVIIMCAESGPTIVESERDLLMCGDWLE